MYHPAAVTGGPPSAVAICAPIGHEYMRTHRALRTLAMQLTRAGHGVLRFDWSGTGDSAGEPEGASVSAWVEDFHRAVEELRELVAAPLVSVVGLRLGGSLAALAAAGLDLDQLVLWDPVVSGARFLAEQSRGSGGSGLPPEPGQTMSLISFPMTRPLWDEIAAIDLMAPRPCRARRVVLVESDPREPGPTLAEQLTASGVAVGHRYIPREGNWDDMDRLGAALLPRKVLQAIVEELG
jgi:pimeloyl-ACP methyl ester carboxylesterase